MKVAVVLDTANREFPKILFCTLYTDYYDDDYDDNGVSDTQCLPAFKPLASR